MVDFIPYIEQTISEAQQTSKEVHKSARTVTVHTVFFNVWDQMILFVSCSWAVQYLLCFGTLKATEQKR